MYQINTGERQHSLGGKLSAVDGPRPAQCRQGFQQRGQRLEFCALKRRIADHE